MARAFCMLCLMAAFWLFAPGQGAAAGQDFHVHPSGAEDATGAADDPFRTAAHALKSGRVRGGDRVLLAPGAHGRIRVANARFNPPVQIVSLTLGAAKTPAIAVENSAGVHFQGIGVWPDTHPAHYRTLVSTNKNTDDIRFDMMDVRATQDAPDTYLDWSKADWTEHNSAKGFHLNGARNAVTRSRIVGTSFAITTVGPEAQVLDNEITGFSGDAMRGLGDGSVFAGNRVRNCFKVSKNHDDGFQSWALRPRADGRKEVSDITIESNEIIEWALAQDHPLRCRLQGIGLFDGHYRNFKIRNNLIVVTAYHGISLYGGIDSVIANNTVVHNDASVIARYPWIMSRDNRNGWEKSGDLVANNVAMGYRGIAKALTLNLIATHPVRVFADPEALDFSPRAEGALIDAAPRLDVAPKGDLTGARRDARPDLGAIEAR